MKKLSTIILLAIFFTSCKKEDDTISPVPTLEFVSITPNSVTELDSKVEIVVKYKDGNGDIGENDPDVKNLFVTDNRNDVVYSYRVKELAPEGSSITIEGNLTIDIGILTITDGSNSQSANFDVYIKDRAGNVSNTTTTSSVIITP